ncbi:hypothetical protein WDJ50_13390 [Deinococcus sp. VB142]|uniref:Uncharacterized protein n=1 Tax=Deinococcus sp. VB142 TaxID=3112952 RepID=A0AAU6Q198_9DEIO
MPSLLLGQVPPRKLWSIQRPFVPVPPSKSPQIPGGLSAIQGDVAGLKLTPTRVDAPVTVQIQEAVDASDSWKLLISSPASAVGRLWPFHKDNYGQPGRSSASDCVWEGEKACEVGTGKGWRYVLVAVGEGQ